MKNFKLKTIFRIAGIIALAAIIGFSMAACGGDDNPTPDPKPNPNPTPTPDPVVLKMQFTENTGWNQSGHEGWCRWNYFHQDAKTNALDKNKAYVLTCSFTSNVDIDELSFEFIIKEPSWTEISNYAQINVPGNVPKNTTYSGKIPLILNSDANLSAPSNIYLYAQIGNRTNATAPILTFSQFSLEAVNKETAGLTKWTVSSKDIQVSDTRRTFAENLSSYQGKNNVFHIKPTYNASTYDHIVMEYDLSSYAGKKIGVEMSFDAYINKSARVAWQMLIAPDYPLVCGYNDETYFLSANTWHTISGNTIVDVPSSGDKKLYLSGRQINGAEAYFANATLVINEGTTTPDTPVTLNSVTADGSSSSKTTQLTLTFSEAITGLTAANINLGSSISGLTKGTLSGSGPTYTLPISGFTTGGTLTVSASKLGYNITPSKTVTIYGGSGGGGGGELSSAWFEPIGSPATAYRVINGGTPPNQVVIPATYNGLPVTAIGSNAFYDCSELTSVNIPNSVISIGEYAFFHCSNLTSVTIGSGVTSIGKEAFGWCANLTSVTFNSTISSANFDSTVFGVSGGTYYIGDLRDKYLAGGAGTYTRTSGGTTWTKQGGGNLVLTLVTNSTFDTSAITAIAYSGSRFVAVGANGKMAYSSDGTTWTVVGDSKFGTTDIRCIAYGNGRFIAGGESAKMAWSSDGATWTAVGDSKFGWSGWIMDIAYGNNKFVAVGSEGTITYSTDNGVNWTAVGDSKFGTTMINGIANSENRFVAEGLNGKMAWSSDGITWTAVGDSKFGSDNTIWGIAYGSGKFVAVGTGNNRLAYSTDNGMTWTAGTISADYQSGIAYCNNKFIAWGNNKLATSPDGLTWTPIGNIVTFSYINGIVWGSNKLVAVGDGGRIAYITGF